MSKKNAEYTPTHSSANGRTVSRGRRRGWDDDATPDSLADFTSDEELEQRFAHRVQPPAEEGELPAATDEPVLLGSDELPSADQAELLDVDTVSLKVSDGEPVLEDSLPPEAVPGSVVLPPAGSDQAFRFVRARRGAKAGTNKPQQQPSALVATLEDRAPLPDDEPLEGLIVHHPEESASTPTAEHNFGSSSEPDVVVGSVLESHDLPIASATGGASTLGAEEPHETPIPSAADVQARQDAERLQAEKDAKAAAASATTPPAAPVFAKPDDAYDVTYDDTMYMGPMKQHMPTREQSTQIREFITSDAYKAAHETFKAGDEALAVQAGRRLKLGMFTTKKTREAQSAAVEAARVEYERLSETFDALQIEKWKLVNPAISEEEINHKLANYHEAKLRLQGIHTQSEIVTSTGKFGKLSEWNNTATEWYAGLSGKQKVAVAVGGIAVGAAGGLAVATAGTVLGAAAGVAGGGLMAGAKVYKTVMQNRSRLHRNTVEVNKADFKNADGSYKEADQLREQSAQTFHEGLEARAEQADKINKKAKWMTIASVALLGAGVASHIDVVHDTYKVIEDHVGGWLDGLQHHGSHNGLSHGITESQGGGSGQNPVDKLGSGDVYTPPKIDVPLAPSHDAFVPTDMGGGTHFSGAGLDHFNDWANGHTVQPGESVWKLSHDYLQANGIKNPSPFQIDAVKDKVLAEFSAKGLVDGNGWLMAGQQLNIT